MVSAAFFPNILRSSTHNVKANVDRALSISTLWPRRAEYGRARRQPRRRLAALPDCVSNIKEIESQKAENTGSFSLFFFAWPFPRVVFCISLNFCSSPGGSLFAN